MSPSPTTPIFRILAIPGSLRRGSLNRRLLEAARAVAPPGVAVELADLRPLPFYDGDSEAAGDPAPVAELKRRIREADALLFATPEYNGAVPGVLQNAVDWASRPRGTAALTNKPIAVVGASPGGGGTASAQRALRQTLANAGALVLPAPELLVPRAGDRFAAHGVGSDAALARDLGSLLMALIDWARDRDRDEARAA